MSRPAISVRCLFAVCWFGVCIASGQGHDAQRDADPMQLYLQSRVEANPADATAWRMLGVYLLQQGEIRAASRAFEQSTQRDPANAASHFGLGQCLVQLGEAPLSARHFQQAALLAPDSDYARQAETILRDLPLQPRVQPASYDVRRFDGSERMRDLSESAEDSEARKSFRVGVDFGAVYNSNVTLTPISREFGAASRSSAQAFLNPVVEYRVINNDFWIVSPTFTGYFSINENDAFNNLNLQSYQPGFYVERTYCCPTTILVPRLQYDYTLDQFDGVTFGNRHAVSASLTSLWDRGDTSVIYWTTNHTDFTDDGADPATSSRDGWTHAAGVSHSWPMCWRFLDSFTLGADTEWADVQGLDFAYLGGSLYVAVEVPLTETLWCEFEAGWGLRDYYDSTIVPSRNETLWRASAKVTKRFTEYWSMAGVFNYDRFASDNSLFEADRQLAGLITSFEY